ncbi:hypothetical protein [Marinobacter salicampi]|uniref:hypothetical protein n=1 Tax=Marinobacter salicampi TaxID=435907 RepID=UPI001F5EB7D4|nr:hypothetical protein [Marinobacter salicampi]
MSFWMGLALHGLVTALVVVVVLAGFYRWVIRPYLDRKVRELIDATHDIEPRVTRGVRTGVRETLRDLPENTARDSTRQFLKFGSDLFENGLSSFLGSSEQVQKRAAEHSATSSKEGYRRNEDPR